MEGGTPETARENVFFWRTLTRNRKVIEARKNQILTTPHEVRGWTGLGREKRDAVHGQVREDSASSAGALPVVRGRAQREAATLSG